MRTGQEQNHRVSVVIPALDAAGELPETLAALIGIPVVGEIIVADGGSADDSVVIAEAAGARTLSAKRGRGTQLAAGAAAASSEWLMFLHADCRLAPGWERAVETFLNAPDAPGRAGYFAFALDASSGAARRLERIVRWRCRVFGLPYGDQGLLIHRTLYQAVGGFAALPLMEDVEFARRLGRGRLAPLGVPAYASARRYREEGYIRRPLRNLICLALYFIGVPARHIVRLYR
jgi:rSAM/selenodomain-associated transferase 2